MLSDWTVAVASISTAGLAGCELASVTGKLVVEVGISLEAAGWALVSGSSRAPVPSETESVGAGLEVDEGASEVERFSVDVDETASLILTLEVEMGSSEGNSAGLGLVSATTWVVVG